MERDRFRHNNEMAYVLDDLGCNGSETNLLECLPAHNCVASEFEDAIVSCGPRGNDKVDMQCTNIYT